MGVCVAKWSQAVHGGCQIVKIMVQSKVPCISGTWSSGYRQWDHHFSTPDVGMSDVYIQGDAPSSFGISHSIPS